MDPQPEDAQGRFDIYGPPHKCIRHAHGTMLTDLGRADFAKGQSELLARLRLHLKMVGQHLVEENRFIHPVLEERAPHATSRLVTQHDEHEAFFGRLEGLIAVCESASGRAALPAARELYLTFSQFVGTDLAHMDEEEQATWPLLCACLTDGEMSEIVQRIAKDYPKEALRYFLPHLAAAATFEELAATLVRLKKAVPGEAYAELFDGAIRPALDEPRLAQVDERSLLP